MTLLIKKYANRRLYDTVASRYVTLEEVADKIKAGADAQVIDAATGEDLTQSTLAQVILESRGAARLLPVSLLTQLIRMGDDALAEFMGRYMSTALELYLAARTGASALTPYNPFAATPFAAGNALARMMMSAPAAAQQALRGFPWGDAHEAPAPHHAPQGHAPPTPPPAAPSQSGADVMELRRELEALKRAVHDAPKPRARRAPRASERVHKK
ncbi:MAG TPA: polyhydroxyalkanoate synthesis regulator DNA-binding domain-containing protein [Byssovorax sp.]